mgnify:FL=1
MIKIKEKIYINHIIITLIIIGIIILFYIIHTKNFEMLWKQIEMYKLIPKIISWGTLIMGIYGIIRRRFSINITTIFFLISFFFAYFGHHIFKLIY